MLEIIQLEYEVCQITRTPLTVSSRLAATRGRQREAKAHAYGALVVENDPNPLESWQVLGSYVIFVPRKVTMEKAPVEAKLLRDEHESKGITSDADFMHLACSSMLDIA